MWKCIKGLSLHLFFPPTVITTALTVITGSASKVNEESFSTVWHPEYEAANSARRPSVGG